MKKRWALALVVVGAVSAATAQILAGYTTVQFQYIISSFLDSTPVGSHVPSTGAFTTLANSTAGGTLHAALIGNVTGNASTATALAAAPTNCGTTGTSYGIAASGNALCGSSTRVVQALTIAAGGCTTGGSEQYCTIAAATWPTAFSNSSYNAVCTYTGIPTGSGSNPGLLGPYIVGQTATTVTVEIQAGSNSAGGTNSNPIITCIGIHT